jgi:eukaryotic-like serine/threonine-protein kinase
VNLLLALLFCFLIGYLLLASLGWFTKHGEYLKVPSVKGKKTEEAISILESRGFEVIIQDSVFKEDEPKNVVIKQQPEADATVKVNRTVFLTVTRITPPTIDMPKLEGLTLRFAMDILARNHLRLGDTVYRPDFMKGSILEQQLNGARIAPGTKVQWGSRITLIIGSGLDEQRIPVPDLVGLTLAEAKAILDIKGITLAGIANLGVVRDSLSAYVHRQNPEVKDDEGMPIYIQPGQTMDVWIAPNIPSIDSIRKARQLLQNPIKEDEDEE